MTLKYIWQYTEEQHVLVQLCSFNPWSPPAVLEALKQSAFNACVPACDKKKKQNWLSYIEM